VREGEGRWKREDGRKDPLGKNSEFIFTVNPHLGKEGV
jgi:hypothetical protein